MVWRVHRRTIRKQHTLHCAVSGKRMTSIITNERRVLRSAYLDLDESLEFLNSEMGKEAISYANHLHRQYQDNPDTPLQALEDALAQPQKTAANNPAIRHQLTNLLSQLYDLVEIIRVVKSTTEEVKEVVIQHLIMYNTDAITREGVVKEPAVDRDRPEDHQDYRTSIRPLAGSYATPNASLGNLDPGDIQQGAHPARAQRNGHQPRRKRTRP